MWFVWMSVVGWACAIKVGKRETREQGGSQECVRATTGNAALTKLCGLVFFAFFFEGSDGS